MVSLISDFSIQIPDSKCFRSPTHTHTHAILWNVTILIYPLFYKNVCTYFLSGPKVTFRWGRSDATEPKDPKDDPRFSPDGR